MKQQYLIRARQDLDKKIIKEWALATRQMPEASMRQRILLIAPKVRASFSTIYRAIKKEYV